MNGKVPPATGPVIHIDEDSWCMRRLFPLSAREEAIEQLDKSLAASEQHKNGSGWNQLHLFEEPLNGYREFGISVDGFVSLLSPIAPRVRDFYATAGITLDTKKHDPFSVYQTNAVCFGFDAGSFVKAEVEDDFVKQIWFDLWTDNLQYQQKVRSMFVAIDSICESYLTDYYVNAGGRIRDHDFLDWYFQEITSE